MIGNHRIASYIGGAGAIFLLCVALSPGQPVRVAVSSPSSVPRLKEPVVIRWASLPARFRRPPASSVQVRDEQGKPIPGQVDDLDGDGTPDEVTFVADFMPHQTRSFFLIKAGRPGIEGGTGLTDAADWKRIKGVLTSIDDDNVTGKGRVRKDYRFDGVGWESELVGYRLYLDERNAVDILAKRKPGLYWNMLGPSNIDYQLDADWGMDVLHIGDALGVGGIGFWNGDSVIKPVTLARQRTRIIARGPVRAVVHVRYTGWRVGGRNIDVSSDFTIYAGERTSEQRVTLLRAAVPETLVTGIVRHDSTERRSSAAAGWLYTTGLQSRAGDSLMMALNVRPSDVLRRTENSVNHLLLLRCRRGKQVPILISSLWQGETGTMWSPGEIAAYLNRMSLRLTEPLKIHFADRR